MAIERGVVYLVGAGPGDPGLLTLRGQEVLAGADCVVYDYLLHPRILDHLRPDAERIFVGKKGGAQVASQEAINELLVARATPQRVVVRLKGGDPFCFGRGGEEARALRQAGVPFRVVPGVTSGIAAPAYAGIPITDRSLSSSVCFLTGTEQSGPGRHNWAALCGVGTLVIYMGVRQLPAIRDALLAHGKDPATPVAAIRWGTWPHQQVRSGTLATFPEELEQVGFQAPAIIVIGAVAALHRELDWCSLGPLAGRSLLVAGPQRSDALTLALEEAGARVLSCPGEALELPVSSSTSLSVSTADCNWLVFTSAAGVRHFFAAYLAEVGDVRGLAHCAIAAIGPSCAAELRRYCVRPTVVPAVHDSVHLVAALRAAQGAGRDIRICHPCAKDGRGTFEQACAAQGISCQPLIVYRSQSRAGAMQLSSEHLDAVCLSSPSALRRFLAHVTADDRQRLAASGATFFAIGQTTAEAMRHHHIPVHVVAARPHIPSLVDTIVAHFAPGSSI